MIHHLVEWNQHADPAKRRAPQRRSLEADIQILSNINDTSKAYWYDNYESLAAWEAAWTALGQDGEFMSIWNEGSEKGFISSVNKHKFLKRGLKLSPILCERSNWKVKRTVNFL